MSTPRLSQSGESAGRAHVAPPLAPSVFVAVHPAGSRYFGPRALCATLAASVTSFFGEEVRPADGVAFSAAVGELVAAVGLGEGGAVVRV